MAYAFEFSCFDREKTSDEDDYRSKKRQVTAYVVADTEEEAKTKVTSIVERETYVLDGFAELSELHTINGRGY